MSGKVSVEAIPFGSPFSSVYSRWHTQLRVSKLKSTDALKSGESVGVAVHLFPARSSSIRPTPLVNGIMSTKTNSAIATFPFCIFMFFLSGKSYLIYNK
jgi:hypothetical protein